MNKSCLYCKFRPQDAVFIHIPVVNRLPVLSTGVLITTQHTKTQMDKMNILPKKHHFYVTGPHTGEDTGQADLRVLSCTTAYRRATGETLFITPVEKCAKTVDNPLTTLLITRQLSTAGNHTHHRCG